MIRTTAVPRPVRAGIAVIGVAGAFALAGCQATATDTADADTGTDTTAAPTTEQTPADTAESTPTGDAAASSTYADGTYTAEGSYATPESVETISVTVTLADDVVTDVQVSGNPQARESERYQSEFIGGIGELVVGKPLDEISVDRVAGSSLTSGGFNEAIETIKSEAAA